MRYYYQYWDSFIHEWQNFMLNNGTSATWGNYNHLKLWQYPCCVYNIINNAKQIFDKSINYLPEPWWGYSGSAAPELHAVCINLNPGSVKLNQNNNSLPNPLQYTQFVNNEVSNFISQKPNRKTNEWHHKFRAMPIFDALTNNGIALPGNIGLENFLSIELLPWHSTYFNYCSLYANLNTNNIFEYSIKFAAKASCYIKNKHLNKKVIVRTSHSTFIKLFQNYTIYDIKKVTNVANNTILKNSRYAIVKFLNQGIDDIQFVLIWQPSAHSNNFPIQSELNAIISAI